MHLRAEEYRAGINKKRGKPVSGHVVPEPVRDMANRAINNIRLVVILEVVIFVFPDQFLI